jgi:D-alanyl-lipoteichoic acid acyltransferase DltB (MBOAT superfamily)
MPPVERFLDYALFISLFPHLIAGPIVRYKAIAEQLIARHIRLESVSYGAQRFIIGLGKKVLIANTVAFPADQIFSLPPEQLTTGAAWFGVCCYAIQIYFDFSGYSDIAVGAAQVMGFRLTDNFNRPYAASSIAEFWKRWHMSLTSWFRDYVYIPLGGNRVSQPRLYANLFAVFVLSGFWHGANWTYVAWGALNGLYLVVSLMTASLRAQVVSKLALDTHPRVHLFVKTLTTFALISFAWIFFRANTLRDAVYIAAHLFDGFAVKAAMNQLDFPKELYFSILFIELIYFTHRHNGVRDLFVTKPPLFRWSMYYVMIMGILVYGSYNDQKFIYFQF